MSKIELYCTEQEAIEAAEKATEDNVPFDPMNFSTQDLTKFGTRSVFYYDGEHSPYRGMYEVKAGDMATYGLGAYKIGTAEFGKFERVTHDSTAELARKMKGLL